MTVSEIRQQIEQFELFQCGLYHEKVQLNSVTLSPIKTSVLDEEHYQRVELCKLEDRRKRLGCAHSISNNRFMSLIEGLDTDNSEIKDLQIKIDDVLLQIYTLDHVKGELEKEFAVSLENNPEESVKNDIQIRLKECISTHSGFINELSGLKKELITAIDRLDS